jgi:hypothetical protein
MSGIRLSLLLALLGLTLLFTVACSDGNEPSAELSDFGIYLEDTGELVISGEHIEAYSRDVHMTVAENEDTHAIELNEAGIKKWNSYMSYGDIPKLEESLYQRKFIVKMKNKEIYRGIFFSMVSSQIYDGVVILDSVLKLDAESHGFFICYGYPAGFATGEDPRNAPEIISFMEEHGLLK